MTTHTHFPRFAQKVYVRKEHPADFTSNLIKAGDHVLGIDPGLAGGASLLKCLPSDSDGRLILREVASVSFTKRCKKMLVPKSARASSEMIERRIATINYADMQKDVEVLLSIAIPKMAFVEDVDGFPKQSAVNAFRFGKTVGAIEFLLAVNDIEMCFVSPSSDVKGPGWKNKLNVKSKRSSSTDLNSHTHANDEAIFEQYKRYVNPNAEMRDYMKKSWDGLRDELDDGRVEAALIARAGAEFGSADELYSSFLPDTPQNA